MKKIIFLLMLFLAACTNERSTTTTANNDDAADAIQYGFDVDLTDNDALDFEKMRIYPIVASEDHIANHQALASYKNLKEAMDIQGFRITEKKPFGRMEDSDAVNNLTVQNKSQDTIYLMAGDVVKGGNQDRVLAQDMVLPPRTLANVEVFCVEQGRWDYRSDEAEDLDQEAQRNKKVYAFTGYYNVVSNDIRKTVKHEKDQRKVWAAVGNLTMTNDAESSTGTYTALENSKDYTAERNRYLAYFQDKMEDGDNVIGMVVVSGNEILGTDIFNHPSLFKKQYDVLLHSYVTDAITNGQEVNVSERKMNSYVTKMKRDYNKKLNNGKESDVKFRYDGKVVHFSHL
ncbi:MAG: DUF6569 family protein [Bacteroidota bacterium]